MTAYNPILDEYAILLGVAERNAQGGFLALCPAHPDTKPSLSVNPGNKVDVVFYCHGGCSQDKVLAALNELRKHPAPAVPFTAVVRTRTSPLIPDEPVTVAALAKKKRLPEDFLESLGLNNNCKIVVIPYRLADGKRAPRHRRRVRLKASDGGSRWTGPKGGLIVPYGLDRLQDEGRTFCFLVEGESDCWTLWYVGFPALGIPGANMTHVLDAEHVAQFERLFVWREPGQGGDTFVKGMAERLRAVGFHGDVREIRGEDLGVKDASDLWCKDPHIRRFKAALADAMKAVRP